MTKHAKWTEYLYIVVRIRGTYTQFSYIMVIEED